MMKIDVRVERIINVYNIIMSLTVDVSSMDVMLEEYTIVIASESENETFIFFASERINSLMNVRTYDTWK